MILSGRIKKKREFPSGAKLQLTSLVDVMTILLVFLLKSFSAEGNMITQSKDLHLPVSSSQTPAEMIKSVKVTKSSILVDDSVLIPISSFKNNDSVLISPLLNYFKAHTSTNKEIMIESDKDQPFDVIKKVMATCSKAGITDFQILVLRED